ncbi:MAG: beta-lactamase family protein [Bacteroidales bacterium]|nr:beta-lactamase family protein [Bacteroidales bacterium]
MKKRVRYILVGLVLVGLISLMLTLCKEKQHGPIPELNIDSLFVDIGKADVVKRTAMAEKTFRNMHKEQGLNGVVLYAEGGQVLYREAFGWRNLVRQKDSIHVDDQFQLASVSKMFTAEAIMLLYSQGKLSYDDDITKYIPEFPYQGITIRNLLNHRSGLSRYETLADEHWPDRGVPAFNDDIIKLFAEYQPDPYNQPDVTFHYTNVNYALLASIVERVSGQHFEDFMKEQIFTPLGMERSYIYSLRGTTRLNTYVDTEVQGHDLLRKGARRAQEDYLNGVVGDKVMYSTVDDLYRFSLAIDCLLFLPDSIQQEAFKPGSPQWKKGENYGFGWRMSEDHPGVLYHFGWWKGYKSYFIRDIEKGRVLIVLTNTNSSALGDLLWDFINDTTVQLPSACPNRNMILEKTVF